SLPESAGVGAAEVSTARVSAARVSAAGVSAAGVVGVGLGITGRVDPVTGTSLREPRIWDAPVMLAGPLAKALGVPVTVDNNVRALALAEILLTQTRKEPPQGLLFIKYGPGVGGAWTTGGLPWAGAHNRAVEIGHTLVEAEGPACPMCGRRGCLESLVSLGALREREAALADGVRRGEARARAGGKKSGGRIEDLLEAMALVAPRDYALLAGRFARALGNAIEILDPSTVALYGTPFRSGRLLGEIASHVKSTGRSCEIVLSGLDPDLPALGGAALALDRFLEEGGPVC
ncbi:MAG TPA: ROK family protein, partial [Magnetospirillaceae bacterium]|nr:ROK family protein [Magnetospirillaceae bacterium]